MSIPQGAFGMYSTVEDLFTFDQALRSNVLLSANSKKMMEECYFQCYGYGWFIYFSGQEQENKCLGHYGDINGFSNQLLRIPDKEIFVAVLSNINITPSDTIAHNIAKIINEEDVNIPQKIVENIMLDEAVHIAG